MADLLARDNKALEENEGRISNSIQQQIAKQTQRHIDEVIAKLNRPCIVKSRHCRFQMARSEAYLGKLAGTSRSSARRFAGNGRLGKCRDGSEVCPSSPRTFARTRGYIGQCRSLFRHKTGTPQDRRRLRKKPKQLFRLRKIGGS